MPAKTILVVDDEPHLLDTVRFILEAGGYTVLTARSGGEALALLAGLREGKRSVDLILTDIQMPGPTGLELIERLAAAREKAPVLVMSGYNDRETVRKLRERGCEHFLDKPFEEEDLLREVRGLLPPAAISD
jgi:CheY-like chemotaxis protein